MIVIYSRLDCVQCDSTYRALDLKGITYEIVFVEINESASAAVKELGYLQAPVVVLSDALIKLIFDQLNDEERAEHSLSEHWSGFRPDQIDQLAKSLIENGVDLQPRDVRAEQEARKELKATIKAQLELVAV